MRVLLPAIPFVLVAFVVAAEPAAAQRQAAPASPAAAPAAPAAAPATPATPAWDSFPVMQLERVYRGPLRDTVVQRWRDTVDGSVCFLYIPISAPLVAQQVANPPYVQYGPNVIGSISCVHPTQVVQLVTPPRPAPPPAPPRGAEPDAKPAGRPGGR